MILAHLRRSLGLLVGLLTLSAPALAQGGAEHLHGPSGQHVLPASMSSSAGAQILSHHDLKITDTRDAGPEGTGRIVEGCNVQSIIYRRGAPDDVIHREHNAYEADIGVYGSHMQYAEPGEYAIEETVTMPDGTTFRLEFPIWVPAMEVKPPSTAGQSLRWGLALLAVLALLLVSYWQGRRAGRRASQAALLLALAAGLATASHVAAQEDTGHAHGPGGAHLPPATATSSGSLPLRAYLGPNQELSATQTRDHYQFELSIENEAIVPDPDLVSVKAEEAEAIGLRVAAVKMGPAADHVEAVGRVVASPDGVVEVALLTGGRVIRVHVVPGQSVRAGQVVALVDSPDLAAAQIAFSRARSEARRAEAEVTIAESGVQVAEAAVAGAGANLERSRAELAQSLAAEKEIQAAVQIAQARRAQATKALEQRRAFAQAGGFSEAQLDQARRDQAAATGETALARESLQARGREAERARKGFDIGVVTRREYDQAESAVQTAKSRVATAETQVRIADARLVREQGIRSQDLRSTREVQQAEAGLETAALELRAAEAADERARQGVVAARASVSAEEGALTATEARLRSAQAGPAAARSTLVEALAVERQASEGVRTLGGKPGGTARLSVVAPTTGTIEAVNVASGETIAAGEPICRIVSVDSVWIQADVFQRDIGRVRRGQRLTVSAESAEGPQFQGVVQSVSSEVDPSSRGVRVRAIVNNARRVLRPDMFVRVLISLGDARVPLAPAEAIQDDDGASIVFVETAQHTYRRTAVKVGSRVGPDVVIRGGLAAGDRVVTQGAYELLIRYRQQ